jgi:hypothetical protein
MNHPPRRLPAAAIVSSHRDRPPRIPLPPPPTFHLNALSNSRAALLFVQCNRALEAKMAVMVGGSGVCVGYDAPLPTAISHGIQRHHGIAWTIHPAESCVVPATFAGRQLPGLLRAVDCRGGVAPGRLHMYEGCNRSSSCVFRAWAEAINKQGGVGHCHP